MGPNILWITTDQQNARSLGVAGNQDIQTPVLDGAARNGVRFTRAYCSNPICQPSRISLITGQRPHRHGAYGNSFQTPDDLLPLTHVVRNQGYQTALIGKGHLGWKFINKEFDYHRLDDPGDVPDFEPLRCDYLRFMIKHKVANKGFYSGDVPLELSNEVWVGNEAVEFLKSRDSSKPFFCWISFQRPHTPPEPYSSMYDPDSLKLPPNFHAVMEGRLKSIQKVKSRLLMDEPKLRKTLSQYYGLVSLIDNQIGRILEELKNQGISENTAIFFTADHGDFAGEFSMMYKEIGIYEPVHRVPMIISFPKFFPKGKVCDEIVEGIDIFPTTCRLTGVNIPDNIDGENLYPLLEQKGKWTKNRAICEHEAWNAIRTKRYRLLMHEEEGCELYDHENDPWETKNVFDNPAYAKVQDTLIEQLNSIISKNARVVTTWRNGFRPWQDDNVPTRLLWKDVKWSEVKKRFGLKDEL